jgi:glycosyltransferase involved in cell wall biosynthesis
MGEYLIVKPGLGVGGGTTADFLTAQALHKVTGWNVRFLTGFVAPFASDIARRESITVDVNSTLDRENTRPPQEVAAAILQNTSDDTRVITSQFFAVNEAPLAEAIVEVSTKAPTAVRLYNRLAKAAFASFVRLSPDTISLPIHDFMAQRMRNLAPERKTIVIPPIIDSRRLEDDSARRRETARIVRDQHGVEDDDILFVQPTNITARKGASSTLHLAGQIQAATGRDTHVLIAGDVRSDEYIEEFARLLKLSSLLGVDCLVDGLNQKRQRTFNRIGELLCAADLATMPSYEDDVMLGIVHAACARVPIYTRAYKDGEGNPVFDSVYGQLDAIVQRDWNVIPRHDVVQQACEVLDGTRQIGLAANAAFAEQSFTAEGIADKLQDLHESFN